MKAYKEDGGIARISILETITSHTNESLLKIDYKLEKLDTKMERLEDRIEDVRKENSSHFRATMFTVLTLIGTPLLMESIKLLVKLLSG